MKRSMIYLAVLLASAASAPAAIAPQQHTSFAASEGLHESVIAKNQAFPLVGPLTVEECLDSACGATGG